MPKYNIPMLQEFADKCAAYWWQRMVTKFGAKIGKMPTIKMNARLTSTAGRAWLEDNYIDLSCYLMERYPAEFRDDTIPHELCHHIAYRLYSDKGHGPAWKNTMRVMGLKDERLHKMVTKSQAQKISTMIKEEMQKA